MVGVMQRRRGVVAGAMAVGRECGRLGAAGNGGVVNRSASHRSTGGTFELDKGAYTRTHEGGVSRLFYTSDMTSPTDPAHVESRWGAFGPRQWR